jgi:two-component system sensor histidine kinase VicK
MHSILNGEQVSAELRFVTKSGDARWVRSITCPIWDQVSGRVVGFYGAGRDVTEEKALKAQQARFITNAMHELSHPVTTILMRLYLMRKQPERLNEHLDALQPIANHLRRMIEDMREVSYLEQGIVFLQKRESVMQQLVATAVSSQEEKFKNRGVYSKLEMVNRPLPVLVDVERVHQAVSSLITNAINLTPEGETIHIQVFGEASDGLEYATVVLSHQGTFGEPDHPTLVFHPFYRASEGHFTHTGLELTITREIIKLHGGSVSIQVEPGNIRVFNVRLPLIQ